METNDIEVFLEVVRAGGRNAAAEAIFFDKTAVGRHVRSLEAAIGAKLFRRRPGKRPLLTPAGELLLAEAPALLQSLRQLSEEMRAADEADLVLPDDQADVGATAPPAPASP